jgi:hypothetical protein
LWKWATAKNKSTLQPTLINLKTKPMEKFKKCDYCGEIFIYERISATYCSDACKQQAYLLRRDKQFITILDAEDTEIESYPDQPINENTEIVPFEETISEAEVLNESESPEPIKSNSEPTKRKRRKSYVPSSGNVSDSKSNADSNANGLGALLGAVAIGYLISEFGKTTNTSTEPTKQAEPTDSQSDVELTIDDEIKEPIQMSDEVPDPNLNQLENTEPFASTALDTDPMAESGNIFVKISKRLNIQWKKLNPRPNKKQVIEDSDNLQREEMEIIQGSTVDSPIIPETNNEKEVEQPLETNSIQKALDEFIRITKKNKNEKDLRERNPGNNELPQTENNLQSIPEKNILTQNENNQTEDDL